MPLMRILDGSSRVKLCFSALRYYPVMLRDRLRRESLWEDLAQELRVAAWEAERGKLGAHDTCLLAGRRICAFLKAYGYHRIRRDGHRGYGKDSPFSSIAEDSDLLEERLAGSTTINELVGARRRKLFKSQEGKPRKADFVRDHPQEAILAILRRTGGMSKRDLYNRLVLTARELDWHCAPLLKQGLIREVKRENSRGRPLTPLLVAVQPGEPLPEPQPDKMERIRQAYFLEGKGIKRIAKEFHHSKRTVRKAIAAPGVFVR